MLRKARLAVVIIFALVSFAQAQDVGHFDVSLGFAGVFSSKSSANSGTTLNPTNSGAILATFRFRFNQMHSLEANFGHTMNSQVFLLSPNNFRVQAGITEFSGAYVFSPFQTARVEPFLFGGAGALRFNPGNTSIDGFQAAFGATQQTSLAFLYGAGADYRLWRLLALRLQCRGLIYKTPDFNLQNLFTGARGHMAEPSVGIVFKF